MSADIQVTDDVQTCLDLRHRVFVEEQGFDAEVESDAHDATATHLLARHDGKPVGTARLIDADATLIIGRVCVLKEMRGTGLGAALILAAVDIARTRAGVRRVKLGAQSRAMAFYEKLGFAPVGDEYDDEGVPHQYMELHL